MNRDREVYAICAVLVPVTLGFGLIYLAIMGDMELSAVLICVVGLAILVPLVAVLAQLARQDPRASREYRRRRKRRPVGAA